MTTHVLYKVYGAFFPVEEATYNALALAGRDDVAVYDGSMTAWAADDELPLVTGPEPR